MAELTERDAKAVAYVRGIRNPAKKAYARAYLMAVVRGQEPPKSAPGLSLMAVQAVRLAITDILEGAS